MRYCSVGKCQCSVAVVWCTVRVLTVRFTCIVVSWLRFCCDSLGERLSAQTMHYRRVIDMKSAVMSLKCGIAVHCLCTEVSLKWNNVVTLQCNIRRVEHSISDAVTGA